MTKQELEDFITEYGRDIYAFCRFLTHDRQEADELYQDVFLKATQYHGRMNIHENPKGYLLSMALRIWKDRQRKAARRARIAPCQAYVEGWEDAGEQEAGGVLPTGMETSPEELAIQKEMRAQVRQAVRNLPEKYKMVVLLYYMEEMGAPQIAQILGLPIGTVKSRLFQARKLLKSRLECIYDE